MNVKAKDANDWALWHYGIAESADVIRAEGRSIPVDPRTVCEDTGLECKGRPVYENDWLELEGDGETHKFLVLKDENGFYAAEDEEYKYILSDVVNDKTSRIVGNIYD